MIDRRLLLASIATLASFALRGTVVAQNVPEQASPPAQAAPEQDLPALPPEPLAPEYQVEMLIFAHRTFDRAEEQFAHENGRATPLRQETLRAPPVFDDSILGPLGDVLGPLSEAPPFGTDVAAAEPGAEPYEFRFRLLQPEELQLTSQYRVLERNPQAYVPLLHGGWVQEGLPENETHPFDLAMLGARNPLGTIQLYLSRFLHVKLDLSYSDALAGAPAPVLDNELTELPITPRYHLTADRPTRSGELHYFDHPAFGVLIKVTPVRPEQTSPATPGTRPAA